MSLSSDKKHAQFIRFCINGCLAVANQYIIYWLLLQVNCSANLAYTVGYVVSFGINFIITSLWTFHMRPSRKRFVGFVSSHILNLFIQMGCLNLYLWLGISKGWAALFAMGSAVPINFAILHFVYKKK